MIIVIEVSTWKQSVKYRRHPTSFKTFQFARRMFVNVTTDSVQPGLIVLFMTKFVVRHA